MSLFYFIVKTVRTQNKELVNFIQELAVLQIARNVSGEHNNRSISA